MQQKDYRGLTPEQIEEGEKKFVQGWLRKIRLRRESPEYRRYLSKIDEWRKYARGLQYQEFESDDVNLVRANLIGAAIANAVPRIYARNPEISVSPTEAVEAKRYELIRRFGKTLEIVLNRQFGPEQAKLKKRAKSNVRAALTSACGWLKVTYQTDIREDPIIRGRIQDMQDNLAELDRLMQELEDEKEVADHEAKREELRLQIEALEQQAEVYRQEGLVIDRVLSENIIVSDDVTDTDSYIDAEWIAERIDMPRSRVKAVFGFAPESASLYRRAGDDKTSDDDRRRLSDEERAEREVLRIWEVWHKGSNQVLTLCEGYDGYMRDPFVPRRTGERWYPYFLYAPIPADGQFIPISYVEQLIELQDEYNTTRTHLREHREKSVPHYVGLKSALTESDARALANPDRLSVTLIEGEPGMPIDQYLKEFTGIRIDPAVYDTSQTRVDFELISGQGDAARGVVAKPKTLGEAEILEQGLQTRMGEMQDAMEDMIQELAQYAAEVLLQELTEEQVLRIAGPGAVWPQMSRDEIFDMVQIEIRAGSTGKPNEQREREAWIQLLPIIRDTVIQVEQMRASGSDDLAEGVLKLLEETLRRFDERIDIESFFPSSDEQDGMDPQKMMQMRQQQEAMQQQADLLRAQIAEIKSKTLKNLAEAEAKEIGQQFDMYMEQLRMLSGLANPEPGQVRGPTTMQ